MGLYIIDPYGIIWTYGTPIIKNQRQPPCLLNATWLPVARTRGLVAGQTCVVRYRLQGACSYYGHNHTVLKDEREPVTGPATDWTPRGGGHFLIFYDIFCGSAIWGTRDSVSGVGYYGVRNGSKW